MVNPKTGRVHTTYAQATAVTGRLASTEPNLQNIPVRTPEGRRIREAFVAPPGHVIVSADYSQIELRIMAHISGDAGMLEAFARGEDIHRATAAQVFGRSPSEVTSAERSYVKAINFGLIYGMSAFGLARQLGLERATAQGFIDSYFARYPGVLKYMEATRAAARERGYVETVFGRRLWLPEIRSTNQARRAGAERAAINAPMQGTAADLIKLAMIEVQSWIDTQGLATQARHASARRAGVRSTRDRGSANSGNAAATDVGRRLIARAARRRDRCRAQLGGCALSFRRPRQRLACTGAITCPMRQTLSSPRSLPRPADPCGFRARNRRSRDKARRALCA